jgi:hypothetical protein
MTALMTKADVAKEFPQQDVKHFRNRTTGKLVRFKGRGNKQYAVFYISGDSRTFCAPCANQDADPPIVAGQLTGNSVNDQLVLCDGCGFPIYPIEVIRTKNTVTLIVRREDGMRDAVLVSYETPVATFSLDQNFLFVTDINWSSSTGGHVGDFAWDMRAYLAAEQGVDKWSLEYPTKETVGQERLDETLAQYLGSNRLLDPRDPVLDYTHQPRLDTAVMNYDRIRAELAAAKTDKVVIKPNRRR